MALFKYKARDREGKIYEKTAEVVSRYDVYGLIREEGGSIISVKEVGRLKLPFSFDSIFGGLKAQEKISFAKNLGLMIEAGLPVTRALNVLSKQAKRGFLKKMLTTIEDDVSHGKTLSEALSHWPKIFSTIFVAMVKAGEESGKVAESLSIVSSQMEKSHL